MAEADFFQWEQTTAARPGRAAVLAIDPGSAKCGVAVVYEDGEIVYRAIVPTVSLLEETRALAGRYRPRLIVMGKGTGSRPLLSALEGANPGIPIESMDEDHTTEEAKKRFLAENPARGWSRLLPAALRTPDRPVDDYVAVILAERYWRSQGK